MSTIRANTISDSAGTGPVILTGQYASKAWANVAQPSTQTLVDGVNISSIVDDGLGLTDLNFTSAMSDADYPVSGMGGGSGSGSIRIASTISGNTAALLALQGASQAAVVDLHECMSAVFGDLA